MPEVFGPVDGRAAPSPFGRRPVSLPRGPADMTRPMGGLRPYRKPAASGTPVKVRFDSQLLRRRWMHAFDRGRSGFVTFGAPPPSR
jgi:hypothetical protein